MIRREFLYYSDGGIVTSIHARKTNALYCIDIYGDRYQNIGKLWELVEYEQK